MPEPKQMAKILLIGGSGAVGQAVTRSPDAPSMHVLLRRALDDVPARHIVQIADPADWATAIAATAPDILICTLGTTMRQAGSQAAFRAVDHDLVIAAAQAARDAGSRHMILVSSVGAGASAANFYLKTKGQVEDALSRMGFDRIDILRPGLLTGVTRPDSRPGEALAIIASPITDMLLLGGLARYRSTPVDRLARAILAVTAQREAGHFVHHNAQISALALKPS
jgi:uncharacterized protein YbjT (DUF2867 family)